LSSIRGCVLTAPAATKALESRIMLMSTTSSGRLKHISAYHEQLTRIRRDLHAHPELGFEEVRTAGIVAGELHHYWPHRAGGRDPGPAAR
jgi:hypothetical protein